MAFSPFSLGCGIPAPARPGIYTVGTWHGRTVALAPDDQGNTHWAHLADDYSLDPLDPAQAKAVQREWIQALRNQPLKLRWPAFSASTGFPQVSLERWKDGGTLPYHRAVRLAQWHHDRFVERVASVSSEAAAAMRIPTQLDAHLHTAAAAMIMAMPEEEIEMAAQIVLHPALQTRTLSPRETACQIEACIVKPRKVREHWEAGRNDLRKYWLTKLRNQALPKTQKYVQVRVATWEEGQERHPWKSAEDAVPLSWTTVDAPEGLCWHHVATRYGAPILILPEDGDPSQCRAVVDELPLWHAEEVTMEKRWISRTAGTKLKTKRHSVACKRTPKS
jgi:hypothetical protein